MGLMICPLFVIGRNRREVDGDYWWPEDSFLHQFEQLRLILVYSNPIIDNLADKKEASDSD